MNEALPESQYLFDVLFNNEQKKLIKEYLNYLKNCNDEYKTDILWAIDQKIGGIGGYCMPADPRRNPFAGGINRELFRPLQYARSEIDACDFRIHPRHVIHCAGMHLEAVMRLMLKETSKFGKVRFNNTTLGKAVHRILEHHFIDLQMSDAMFRFVELFNKSKHDINQDNDRDRFFTPADAIVGYFSARIIGQNILMKIDFAEAFITYEINNEPYLF